MIPWVTAFTFTTGTTGLNSKIFVSGSSRMGLNDLELVTGTTPSFVNMATRDCKFGNRTVFIRE